MTKVRAYSGEKTVSSITETNVSLYVSYTSMKKI